MHNLARFTIHAGYHQATFDANPLLRNKFGLVHSTASIQTHPTIVFQWVSLLPIVFVLPIVLVL